MQTVYQLKRSFLDHSFSDINFTENNQSGWSETYASHVGDYFLLKHDCHPVVNTDMLRQTLASGNPPFIHVLFCTLNTNWTG